MLTIREAAEKTGHSVHKIRRLIKSIADQPTHDDRSKVEPSPSDVERLNAEGVQFTWRISEEVVTRRLGEATMSPSGTESTETTGVGESGDLLKLLQRAIDAKEHAEARLFEQLRVKDEQIASLNERLHESHVLMQSLQKQLSEPSKTQAKLVEAATQPSGNAKGKGTPQGVKKGVLPAVKTNKSRSAVPETKSKRRSWLKSIFS